MVETRLPDISSNKNLFSNINKDYNDALKINGYNYKINYTEERKNKNKIEKENSYGSIPHIVNLLKQTKVKSFLK